MSLIAGWDGLAVTINSEGLIKEVSRGRLQMILIASPQPSLSES